MIDNPADQLRQQMEEVLSKGNGPSALRYALACLGVLPGIGGALAGVAGVWSEQEQQDFKNILRAWLKLQEDEIREIGTTIIEIMTRLDLNDQEIRRRIEGPEYLRLIKRCFRDWSAAESEEKRRLIRNLLTNAVAAKICTDDVVGLFIKWIDFYSESHFAVIREVYRSPGTTRQLIWNAIHGDSTREDSAEADLFKLLIHDLSTGHVIRQHREKDYYGNFLKASPRRKQSVSSQTMTSAFDDEKQYELTELGQQFVRYTMNEMVPRIGAATHSAGGEVSPPDPSGPEPV
jgi:hypothetical protein